MHTTSAFSVWCWLVLSILRYIAVFHPIKYRTIWRQALGCCCLVFESWILVVVVYSEDGRICTEQASISQHNLEVV
ncbi:unnamed protein product [Angiostrongylus costaricensis]|uniref:G_PROTEIN_RECEP_F1_2 domain-containing protein n=1 Tax=Angiostrongylus costaricensis TaxID=334426 RepID=A0A0R3PRE1_ANGCS|nr:unnamed protein product [Angiostrongylus costaricensis]